MTDATPRSIFVLARHNPIAAAWLAQWEAGQVDWEKMLLAIAKDLESECHNLLGKAKDLGYTFSMSWQDLLMPPNFSGSETPLERQEKLLVSIQNILTVYNEIFSWVVIAIERQAAPVIELTSK